MEKLNSMRKLIDEENEEIDGKIDWRNDSSPF
jgi:hypothetical protein